MITFVCYGSWLHGRAGSVDHEHNAVGSPTLEESPRRLAWERSVMTQAPYVLDEPRRAAALQGIKEACSRRGWILLAAQVRASHVHAVVDADRKPEQVMSALKAYASRALNESEYAAVNYVVNNRGETMAAYAATRSASS